MNSIKNILYLGWLGKGNVGDDVLFEIFKHSIYKYHIYNHSQPAINIDAFPIISNYEIDISHYDLIVLGGGSLLHLPYWLRICKKGMEKNIPTVCWGTGIDGGFQTEQEYLYMSAYYLTNFTDIYNQFDYMSVRGPYTKQMLETAGTTSDINVIGDPALCYLYEGIQQNNIPAANCHTILINWGTAYNHLSGDLEIELENEIILAIRMFIQKGYNISIYPIWTEDIPPVQKLAEKINHPQCVAHEKVYEARTLIKMMEQCYLSINLKLHANILSAAANRPFISLAYGGKCFDFSASADLLNYTIAVNKVTHQGLLALFEELEQNYESAMLKIQTAKEKYYPELVGSIRTITEFLYK